MLIPLLEGQNAFPGQSATNLYPLSDPVQKSSLGAIFPTPTLTNTPRSGPFGNPGDSNFQAVENSPHAGHQISPANQICLISGRGPPLRGRGSRLQARLGAKWCSKVPKIGHKRCFLSAFERSYGIEISGPTSSFLGGSLSPLPQMPNFQYLARVSVRRELPGNASLGCAPATLARQLRRKSQGS